MTCRSASRVDRVDRRGPNGAKLKAPAVVERSCAYDEFLKEEEGQTLRRKERWDAGLVFFFAGWEECGWQGVQLGR